MKKYKNIIFDLGGVILDINYQKTIDAFKNLQIKDAENLYSKASQMDLFDEFEKGNISDKEFCSGIRQLSEIDLDDEQIKRAWNSLLITFSLVMRSNTPPRMSVPARSIPS